MVALKNVFQKNLTLSFEANSMASLHCTSFGFWPNMVPIFEKANRKQKLNGVYYRIVQTNFFSLLQQFYHKKIITEPTKPVYKACLYNAQIKFLALFFGIPEWFCGLACRGMTVYNNMRHVIFRLYTKIVVLPPRFTHIYLYNTACFGTITYFM